MGQEGEGARQHGPATATAAAAAIILCCAQESPAREGALGARGEALSQMPKFVLVLRSPGWYKGRYSQAALLFVHPNSAPRNHSPDTHETQTCHSRGFISKHD